MPLFKCRDCGYDVDDPTTHICGPPPSATSASRYGGGRGYDDPYSPAAARSPYGGYGSDSYSNSGKSGAGGRPASPPRPPYDDRYRYGNGSSNAGGGGGGGGYSDRSPYDDYGSSARNADNGRAPPSPAPDAGKPAPQQPSEAEKKAAGGFGLDFFSSSYNKLFGGAGGASSGDKSADANNKKGASDAGVDDVTRKLDATSLNSGTQQSREQVATMYSNTSSMPPQTPAAADTDVIELSEIMLFKDTKGVTCTGCRAPVWKGEEIVCIDMDVVHATCCVCQECGLTADRDPYGSDGWKQIGGIVVCADCLARDPSIGQSSAAPPMGGGGSSKVQPEPSSAYGSKPVAPPAPPTPDYEVCGTCRLSIMNPSEIVTHPKLKGSHHARCLTCQHCNRGIDESFGPSNPVHVRQSRPLCHPCYLITLPRCGGCKNVITRDTRVCAALGRKYHPQCFVCAKCSTSFPDKSFYVLKDQPYCRQCYHEENGTICGGCMQPIEGPCACVVEGRFHPNCFACATCRDPLTDVYYSYEGRPYCEVHILELQRRRGGKAERRQTYYRNM